MPILGPIISGTYLERTDRHILRGNTEINYIAKDCLICVFDNTTFVLLAAKFSNNSNGNFEFKGMYEYPEKSLMVVAIDPSGLRNSLIYNYESQITE